MIKTELNKRKIHSPFQTYKVKTVIIIISVSLMLNVISETLLDVMLNFSDAKLWFDNSFVKSYRKVKQPTAKIKEAYENLKRDIGTSSFLSTLMEKHADSQMQAEDIINELMMVTM